MTNKNDIFNSLLSIPLHAAGDQCQDDTLWLNLLPSLPARTELTPGVQISDIGKV